MSVTVRSRVDDDEGDVKWPLSVTVVPINTRAVICQMEYAVACVKVTMALGNVAGVPRATIVCGCRKNTDRFIGAFRDSCAKAAAYGPEFALAKDEEKNDVIIWANIHKDQYTVTCITYEETATRTLIGRGLVFQSPTMYTDCLLQQFRGSKMTSDRLVTFLGPLENEIGKESDLHPHALANDI
jgi:hypothetical protein